MLKKFVSIKNVGTFRNSGASGDVELRRLTLMHAENGRGKTTLCAILRSLRNNDPNLILERKTLDSDGAPQVQLLLDAGMIEFKDGKWGSTYTHIEIFDATFVAENVYSGDLITHDHKRNLCRVVLGSLGAQLAKNIDSLDAQVRTLQSDLSKATAALDRLVPAGFTRKEFIELADDPEIDKKIQEKLKERQAVGDAESIRMRPALALLKLPQPPANLTAMLQKTVEGVSADAEEKVRQHLATHGMTSRGETWIAEGLQYAKADDCPFCAQALAMSPLTQAYASFFSTEYRRFQQELALLSQDVDQSLSDAILLDMQKGISSNAALIESWKKYIDEQPPQIEFDDSIAPVIVVLRASLAPLLAQKLASPLESVKHTNESLDCIGRWKVLRKAVQAYNECVDAYNTAIRCVKEASRAKNVGVVELELAKLNAQKARFRDETREAVDAYRKADVRKLATQIAKEKAKLELDSYNERIVERYQETVNDLLLRFGAGFTLSQVKIEYTGRTARTAYTFCIRGKEIDPGSDRTPPGTPCFANTLSSGDRSTLALAFFIAQLKNRNDLSTLLVVFDDPFTSLDSFRQHWTCNAIQNLATKAKQVLVLSHSLAFLKLLSHRCLRASLKELQIDRHGTIDSRIAELDLEDETRTAVERDIVQLRNYVTGDDTDPVATIRSIRPLLENYIRRTAPGACPKGNGWLGDILGEIAKAQAQSPLAVFTPVYEDLDLLNQCTAPYAHDSGNVVAIDDGELRNFAALTLKLVGAAM